jgi:hypothetical protein
LRQDPNHQRDKHETGQSRKRGDQYAGPEKDDGPNEERDLAYIEWWEAEIGEAFPHQRIAQQHNREQREITIALGKRASGFGFERSVISAPVVRLTTRAGVFAAR